jgi:hypothetical protein
MSPSQVNTNIITLVKSNFTDPFALINIHINHESVQHAENNQEIKQLIEHAQRI